MVEVTLWLVDLDPPGGRLAALREHLDPDEVRRAERFLVPHVGRRFTAARGALREILATATGQAPAAVRFAYGQHGKPWLPDHPDLRFNLSHSHERALVGLSGDREIGVDLEALRQEVEFRRLAERFFSDPERDDLRQVPEEHLPRAFFRLWTRKEAYLKARGKGLALPLGDFAVALGDLPDPSPMLWTRDRVEDWWVQEVDCGEGYVGALCAEGSDWRAGTVREWSVSW